LKSRCNLSTDPVAFVISICDIGSVDMLGDFGSPQLAVAVGVLTSMHVCVCMFSLNANVLSSRQSQSGSGVGFSGIVSAKSDPTLLPTEFSRPSSAPLSKVALTYHPLSYSAHLCSFDSAKV